MNVKSPIAFSGVTNLYRFYGGLLSHKKIKNYLKTIDSYTLHKKSRVLSYNPSYSRYRRQQFQVDLVDIQKLTVMNDNFKYLLMAIDTFTRYGFCEPLKNKQSVTVLEAFQKILQKAKDYPESILSDSGTEFTNKTFLKFCSEKSIKCYRSYTSMHAPYVERYNRTIKNIIFAFMDGNKTERFIDNLEDLIKIYNTRYHRMIKMTPTEAEKRENHGKVRINMWNYYKKFKHKMPDYKIGDTVRISNLPSKFQREFEIQNQNEIFVIHSVNSKLPLSLYKLHTYGDLKDVISGLCYKFELTPTVIEEFYIEKIIKKRKNQILVKWLG